MRRFTGKVSFGEKTKFNRELLHERFPFHRAAIQPLTIIPVLICHQTGMPKVIFLPGANAFDDRLPALSPMS
jgi:hypothetical protein